MCTTWLGLVGNALMVIVMLVIFLVLYLGSRE